MSARTRSTGDLSRQKLVATSRSSACSSLKPIEPVVSISLISVSARSSSALGQAEHMLADDIALDLARAAADGGGEGVQIAALPDAPVIRIRLADVVARLRALHGQRNVVGAPEELRAHELGNQADRERAVLIERRNGVALHRKAQGPVFHEGLHKLVRNRRVLDRGHAAAPRARREIEKSADVRLGHDIAARLTSARAALILKRAHGHEPALALLAHEAGGGNARIGEEGLGEAVFARELANGHGLDAGHMHGREEEAQ